MLSLDISEERIKTNTTITKLEFEVMNGGKISRKNQLLLASLCTFISAGSAFGQTVTLANGNATATVQVNSPNGMNNWTVDGANQLNQQWFWYRAGSSGGESPINALGPAVFSSPTANTLLTSYNGNNYGVSIAYVLTGFSAGSGHSQISETITITNSSASALEFHFFQYSDFDLGGSGNDSVILTKYALGPNAGKYNEAIQSDGSALMSESVITPGANHGEASLFPTTLTSLNNGTPTTLSDVTTAGPGDATWAFQWDFTIAPGASVGISKIKDLQVPEPTSLALLGLGAVGLVLGRRRSA